MEEKRHVAQDNCNAHSEQFEINVLAILNDFCQFEKSDPFKFQTGKTKLMKKIEIEKLQKLFMQISQEF